MMNQGARDVRKFFIAIRTEGKYTMEYVIVGFDPAKKKYDKLKETKKHVVFGDWNSKWFIFNRYPNNWRA